MNKDFTYIRKRKEEYRREKEIQQQKQYESQKELDKQKEFIYFSIVEKNRNDKVEWYYEPIGDKEFSEYRGCCLEILDDNNIYIDKYMSINCRLHFLCHTMIPLYNYRILPPKAGLITFPEKIVKPGRLIMRLEDNELARIKYEETLKRRDAEYQEYRRELEREETERLKGKSQAIKMYTRAGLLQEIQNQRDNNKRSRYIPQSVVGAVFHRDGCRCVICGSTENLQLDHIIPHSLGGANTIENLQVLCQKCNLEKSNKI